MRFPLLGEDGAARRASRCWSGRRRPGPCPATSPSPSRPDVAYVRARVEGETLILAEPLVEQVLGEGAEVARAPARRRARRPPATAGPVFELADGGPAEAFRVLAGDFVTTEDGTGLVHIAPAFGEDDYAVSAADRDLRPDRARQPLQPGRPRRPFTDAGQRLRGPASSRTPRSPRGLIADLERRGLLFRAQVYEHAYPHCWRCGTPLLYYAKSSWYVATSQVRDQLLANNEEIGWHPEHVKHGRFGKWLENNVDWALSRDRYWGTPLPIWECAGDGLRRPLLRRLGRRAARARPRRGPRGPAPPLHRRGRPRLRRSAAARCAGSTR